jgi:hypothetical protein
MPQIWLVILNYITFYFDGLSISAGPEISPSKTLNDNRRPRKATSTRATRELLAAATRLDQDGGSAFTKTIRKGSARALIPPPDGGSAEV